MIIIKILIFGGTGFIGERLLDLLIKKEYEIVIMTRDIDKVNTKHKDKFLTCEWSNTLIEPCEQLNNIDVVINLAGESIGTGTWTEEKKERIIKSRTQTTNAIVNAIEKKIITPKTLINASAVGYYGPQGDQFITENYPPGDDFLASVCIAWEKEAERVEQFGVRLVILRFGLVLGRNGGTLEKMSLPYKFFVGGPIGSGKQWISWIHIDDLIRIIDISINNLKITSPVNVTAPNPVTMKKFSKTLGKALKRPSIFRTPTFIMRLVLGEMANLIVNGQRVIPTKIIAAEYDYIYPTLKKALREIYSSS